MYRTVRYTACLLVIAIVGCTTSHTIVDTQPPPDQPPLSELEAEEGQQTDLPGETSGEQAK